MTTDVVPRPTVGRAIEESLLIAKRNMVSLLRRPDIVTFIFVQPIIFLLMFIYVFGGAIEIPGLPYTDFAMPGIILATLIFDAPATALGLNEDLSKGILDRFRSLPISRIAVLLGRIMSDAVRAGVVTMIIVVIGYAVGFRFYGGLGDAALMLLISWLFAVSIGWASAIIGLAVPSPEAVQAAVFTAIFPLVFVSSIYVPVQSMPGWLQPIAQYNPISIVADAGRELALGPKMENAMQVGLGGDGNPWAALAWSVGMTAVFIFLAVRQYRKLP
jgi:ABC-2 type transport system permease protein/oleandomycin transport system permease protein